MHRGWRGGGNGLFDFFAGSALLGRRSNANLSNSSKNSPLFGSGPAPKGQARGLKAAYYTVGLAITGLTVGPAIWKLHHDHAFSGPINFFSVYFPGEPKPFKPNVAPLPAPAVKFLHGLYDRQEMKQARRASPDSQDAHLIRMHGAAVVPTENIRIDKNCVLPKEISYPINAVMARDARKEWYSAVIVNLPNLPSDVCPNRMDRTTYVPIDKVKVDEASLSAHTSQTAPPPRDNVKMSYSIGPINRGPA